MSGTATATVFGRPLLPPVPDGEVPFWRVVLRGCSQCCFQTNEVTGVIFLLAVLAYSWRMAAYMLIGAIAGPAVAICLRGERILAEQGLYGFNSCLMALALGNFLVPGPGLWLAVVVLSALVGAVTVVLMRLLPFPAIAAPFILTFWSVWPLMEGAGLEKLIYAPFADERVYYVPSSLAALGATLFSGTILSGALYFLGVLVSNWRHAVIAFVAAFFAHVIAVWWGVPGQAVNIGLAGLNAVLASVGIYVLCAADIRLALLGGIVAGAVLRLFSEIFGLIPLAAGFVLITWTVMLLGKVQDRYFDTRPAAPASMPRPDPH